MGPIGVLLINYFPITVHWKKNVPWDSKLEMFRNLPSPIFADLPDVTAEFLYPGSKQSLHSFHEPHPFTLCSLSPSHHPIFLFTIKCFGRIGPFHSPFPSQSLPLNPIHTTFPPSVLSLKTLEFPEPSDILNRHCSKVVSLKMLSCLLWYHFSDFLSAYLTSFCFLREFY